MPLAEQSHRLTQFVIENHQNESNKLFYKVSIVDPAAFSAIMSKSFRTLTSFESVIKKLVNR